MSKDEQDEFLKKCAEEEANLPKMLHPKGLMDKDIEVAKQNLREWFDMCDQEDREKGQSELMKAADAIADDIVRDRLQAPIRGILTIYVDIGTVDSVKGDALLERAGDRYRNILRRLPKDWDVMYVPTRNSGTRVEMLKL